MATEYSILFFYQHGNYAARVIRSSSGKKTMYAVRPRAISLIKGFGPQTLLFSEGGEFGCEGKISLHQPDYIRALVDAIKKEDSYWGGRLPA
jgi:hypothetical protein